MGEAKANEVFRQFSYFFRHARIGCAGQFVVVADVVRFSCLFFDFKDAVGEAGRPKGEAVDFPLHARQVFFGVKTGRGFVVGAFQPVHFVSLGNQYAFAVRGLYCVLHLDFVHALRCRDVVHFFGKPGMAEVGVAGDGFFVHVAIHVCGAVAKAAGYHGDFVFAAKFCPPLLRRGFEDFVQGGTARHGRGGRPLAAQLGGEGVVGGDDGAVFGFVVVEEVHFVDGDDDVRAAQVVEDGAVPLGLRQEL